MSRFSFQSHGEYGESTAVFVSHQICGAGLECLQELACHLHDELEYRVGGRSEGRPRDRQDDIGGPEEEGAGPISQRGPGQVSAGGE